ncbi:MAG: hypothetical protein HF314_04440 [Ignavibacteria bacterium]|jgi:hypothetical protein|nr:hypothetical protein [Ignavibacteria bacterium]MCU7502299.1 hypothetical protein [Ignavibacteria bacterium]MCU7516657.1 hypothetical protein [Ignavibacteria bacterium]
MKYLITYLSFILIAGLIAAGCSEIKKDLPVQPSSSSVVHGPGFAQFGHPNFHGNYLKKNNWDIKQCQGCHTNYNAGGTGTSCRSCHTQQAGPEACNTCHGDFSNPNYIAPPEDTNDSTRTALRGVGAHSSHLYTNQIGKAVVCSECHTVPTSVFQPGHIDGRPAEVNFGTFTVSKSISAPVYNPSENPTCANVYCHGNFAFSRDSAAAQNRYIYLENQITGNITNTPTWTELIVSRATSQVLKCGTCHDMPPKGHVGHGTFTISSCAGCHIGIVDEQGNILDKERHINGAANVRGQ